MTSLVNMVSLATTTIELLFSENIALEEFVVVLDYSRFVFICEVCHRVCLKHVFLGLPRGYDLVNSHQRLAELAKHRVTAAVREELHHLLPLLSEDVDELVSGGCLRVDFAGENQVFREVKD